MLREACFVWNHALALQKRYYKLYRKYISAVAMQKHFTRRIKRTYLHSQSTQEILQRLDNAYQRFFKHKAKRPPKFKKAKEFTSFCYKQGGFALNGNVLHVNSVKKNYKFSLSRPYLGKVKQVRVKRSRLNEYYICIVTDAVSQPCAKTHNGASVGIDFGLKTYMTFSDGRKLNHPQFLKKDLRALRKASIKHSRCMNGSSHKEQARLSLCRLHERIANRRMDYQSWEYVNEYLLSLPRCEMFCENKYRVRIKVDTPHFKGEKDGYIRTIVPSDSMTDTICPDWGDDDVYYVYCGETYYDAEVNANIGFDRPSHLEDIIELCTN